MKTILKWDLRQRRNFIFWWTFGVFIFVFITLIFYPASSPIKYRVLSQL